MDQYIGIYTKVKKRIIAVLGIFICLMPLYAQTFDLKFPFGNIQEMGKIQSRNVTEFYFDSLLIISFNGQAMASLYDTAQFDMSVAEKYFNNAIAMAKKKNYLYGEMITYNNLGHMFNLIGLLDSSRYYFRKAMAICEIRCDTANLMWCYQRYGMTFSNEYRGDSAYIMYKKAQELAAELNDKSAISRFTSSLANMFLQNEDMMQSAKYCLENARTAEIDRDTQMMISAYRDLSILYSSSGLVDKQVELVRKIIVLTRNESNKELYFWGNFIAAKGFLDAGKYDSVLYYARLNMPVGEKILRYTYAYRIAGDCFLKLNRIDSARYYYKLYSQWHLLKSWPMSTDTYLNMGTCELKSGNHETALKYYQLAESESNKWDISSQQRAYKTLYEYFDGKGDYRIAISYLKKYNSLQDSIQSRRNEFKTGLISMVLESEKMEDQINVLKMKEQYQSLLTSKQVQEKRIVFASSILILCLFLLGFIRFRKYNQLKGKQSLMSERLRISHELHDEVGATLSGIAMYSHVATDQLKTGKNNEVQNSLAYMQKSAGEMVNKLSDIVWLLNPEQDTIMELFGRLGEYGKQMTRVRDMQIRIDLPADLASKHIPLEARRNIYLFCKEAINNAVKYSNGRLLVLQVKSEGHQMVFSVTDDGNGFDVSIVGRGNGLVSMQKRAQDIGAEFHIDTKVNQGTRLELQYKIIQ